MRNIIIGFVLGWLVATIGFAGITRIAERIAGAAQTQVLEMSK